jgi:hypothetical protein
VVNGGKELQEKLGRNDPCPCGSGRRFQELLHADRRVRRLGAGSLLQGLTARTLSCEMKNSDVPMMALRRAVELCGGIDALGDNLNVPAKSLERWLAGDEEVPVQVFTQAVGLLLDAMANRPPRRSPDPSDGGRKQRNH